jgi:hypothetical protein
VPEIEQLAAQLPGAAEPVIDQLRSLVVSAS